MSQLFEHPAALRRDAPGAAQWVAELLSAQERGETSAHELAAAVEAGRLRPSALWQALAREAAPTLYSDTVLDMDADFAKGPRTSLSRHPPLLARFRDFVEEFQESPRRALGRLKRRVLICCGYGTRY